MSGLILHARTAVFLIVSLSSIACYGADLDTELQNRALAAKAKTEVIALLAEVTELCILDDQYGSIELKILGNLFREIEVDTSQVYEVYVNRIGGNPREVRNADLLKQRIFSERTLPDNLFTFKGLKTPNGLNRIKQLHDRVRARREENKKFDSIYNLTSVNLIASLIANGQQAEVNGIWQQLDQKKYSIEWIQNFSLTLMTELADPKRNNFSTIEAFIKRYPTSLIGYRAKLLYLSKNNKPKFEGQVYKETIRNAFSFVRLEPEEKGVTPDYGTLTTKRVDGLFKLLCYVCGPKDRDLIREVFQIIQKRNPEISTANQAYRIDLVEKFDARDSEIDYKITETGREMSVVRMLMELDLEIRNAR